MYGNLDDLDMCPGDLVSWHVLALGSEVDIHSIYFHGHTVLEGENRRSTVTVQPGSHHTLVMEADAEGELQKCYMHVSARRNPVDTVFYVSHIGKNGNIDMGIHTTFLKTKHYIYT